MFVGGLNIKRPSNFLHNEETPEDGYENEKENKPEDSQPETEADRGTRGRRRIQSDSEPIRNPRPLSSRLGGSGKRIQEERDRE